MNARQLREQTENVGGDYLAIDETRTIARQIADAVRDPKMHPTIAMKVARAVATRRISPDELIQILDYVVAKRVAGELRSPGAYFVTSIKRVFQANEVPW